MKIQTNVISTIGIILTVVLSATAFNTFSFAEMTNNTNNTSSQSAATTTNTNTAKVPSQIITTTNPVVRNITLMSGSGCSNVNYLWNHVYGASGDGKHQWSQPGPIHKSKSRLTELQPCVTVTGQVYSIYPPTAPGRGTHDDPDGDLHFTLTLLDHPEYSNSKDPSCKSFDGLPDPCHNIIVEVICHTTPAQSYSNWGDYCNNVNSIYPHGQFPKQGDKLTVSGKLVRDEDEGWNEIHPASDIHITH
ncbi:MAG: hypothetical protein ACTHKK_09085 [Candidatus Nitrosocosmicus sp.]